MSLYTFEMEWTVVNTTVCGTFSQKLDLDRLGKILGTTYDPKKFSGLIWRSVLGGCFLIFSSGKFTLLGVTSTEVINEVIIYICNLTKLTQPKFQIKNVVVSAKINRLCNLHDLARYLHEMKFNVLFDPCDHMPPLRLRFFDTTVLIHHTGKLIITGISTFNSIEPVINELNFLLSENNVCNYK